MHAPLVDATTTATVVRSRLAGGLGSLLLASALFGVMAVCVRAASREMPAAQIAFVRFVGSFLFMLAVTRGRGLTPRPGNHLRLVLRGVIGAVSITCYFVGIEGAGAGLATLVQNSYPVFAATLAALLGHEVFTRRLGAALALSVLGALVVLGARVELASATTVGILASIAASMLAGAAVVTAQQLRRSEGAAIITTWFMGVGVIVTAPALLGGLPVAHGSTLLLLASVVLTSVLAQWLLHHGLGFTSATQGSLAAATSVFLATAIEALTLGDRPSARTLAGAALMLSAVALAWRRPVPVAARSRTAAAASLLLALALVSPSAAHADSLHDRAIVVDLHSDCTQRLTYDGVDLAQHQPDMQVDLPKMRAGGLDAEFFSIFVGPWRAKPEAYYAEALRQLDAVHALIRAHPDAIAWARTAADVRRNAQRGVVSALFGVEGAHALLPGEPPELLDHLRTLYARGARYMTLTWSIASPVGGSSGDDSRDRGLTDVGRQIVEEMQRLGMMVDVSHVSDALFWDVVRTVKKPVIASHSSARALADVPRNMSDEMLVAVAQTGGAVCVNFGPEFLDADFAKQQQAIRDEVRKLGLPQRETWRLVRERVRALPPVPLARLIDHVAHVARVAGVEHVCLGSDFDGVAAAPAGLEDASHLPALTAGLRARGFADADVERILGGNVLRVLEANEPPAAH